MLESLNSELLVVIARNLALLIAALGLARLSQMAALALIYRTEHLLQWMCAKAVAKTTRAPLLLCFSILALAAALPLMHLPEVWLERLQFLLRPTGVAAFGWLIVGIIRGVGNWLANRYAKPELQTALRGRRLYTQVKVLTRTISIIVAVLTVIGMALVVPALRELGMSLFASAGVAGIVLGFAAKTTLQNLIAGVQLALSQHILLGDEVVVEGEFGNIEEITASYVVVKIWDQRRLIVPLNHFMENPYENWTYREPDMLGTIFLNVDFTVDIEALRAEAKRVAESNPKWDKKTCKVQTTGVKDNMLELRVLLSARNSSDLTDLRYFMLEKLVAFLQRTQQGALPQTRLTVMEQPGNQNMRQPARRNVQTA